MQVCDYCKTDNADDHKFCKECGNRLKSLVAVEFEHLEDTEQLDLEGMKSKTFVYSTRGDFDRAVAELVRAIREHPHVPELHYQLGTVYHKNHRIENAIDEFERCISLDRRHFKALLKLGNIYGEEVRSHEMAVRIYKLAVEVKPDYPDLRNNLGNAYRFLGRNEDAVEQFSKAIELNPRYARAMFNLGKAFSAMGTFQEAEKQYRRALEVDRNHAKAHKNLGETLMELGRVKEALDFFAAAVGIDPSYVNGHMEFAKALEKSGRHDDAVRQAEAALKLRPELGSVEKILSEPSITQGGR